MIILPVKRKEASFSAVNSKLSVSLALKVHLRVDYKKKSVVKEIIDVPYSTVRETNTAGLTTRIVLLCLSPPYKFDLAAVIFQCN